MSHNSALRSPASIAREILQGRGLSDGYQGLRAEIADAIALARIEGIDMAIRSMSKTIVQVSGFEVKPEFVRANALFCGVEAGAFGTGDLDSEDPVNGEAQEVVSESRLRLPRVRRTPSAARRGELKARRHLARELANDPAGQLWRRRIEEGIDRTAKTVDLYAIYRLAKAEGRRLEDRLRVEAIMADLGYAPARRKVKTRRGTTATKKVFAPKKSRKPAKNGKAEATAKTNT